jgi:hypothetical protein
VPYLSLAAHTWLVSRCSFWRISIPDYATISSRAEAIAERLVMRNHDVVSDCDFEQCIVAASEPGPKDSYRSHAPALTAQWKKLRDEHGKAGLDEFNNMLMCRAILRTLDSMESQDMPELLKQEYARNYVRILDRAEASMNSDNQLSDDLVAKDLGLCTQRLFPAGYCVVEIRSSMARRSALLGGARQFLDFCNIYYLRFGGRGPFLSNHFHPEWTHLFSNEGRIHMFKVVATIMEWRPTFKAIVGSAWFYDPVVAKISPHLAFVRDYPEQHGATFFRGPPDRSGNALVSSRRQRMCDRGEYHPRKYVMVWTRDSLVDWLHREFERQ